MQEWLTVLQIVQIAIVVCGVVAWLNGRRIRIKQAVHIVNLLRRGVINRHRMLDAVARKGLTLIKVLQVVGQVLVVAAVYWHG